MNISYTPMSVASRPASTDGSTVPFCIPQMVHDHQDTIVGLRYLPEPPQTELEVDFLGGRRRRHILAQFRYGLDGFYPLVHVRMEGVQESAVVQEIPRNIVVGSDCVGLSPSTAFRITSTSPREPTKGSNHGFTPQLTTTCKLSYGVLPPSNRFRKCS